MCLWFDSHHPLFVCNECAKNESISFLAFFILDKLYTFSLLTCFFLCYPIVIALEKRTELRRFFLWKRKPHSKTFPAKQRYNRDYYRWHIGGADVLFAPEFVFQQYADVGSLMPLTDYLTADELEQYKDMIVYATDSETGETFPCGLELNDNQWLSAIRLQHL